MTDHNPALAAVSAGRHYLIATDGACIPNPGPGSWGLIKLLKEGETILRQLADAGHSRALDEPGTTNIRMEMYAALRAVEGIQEVGTPAIIETDSEHVFKGMTEWLPRWKTNRWRGSKGGVKNRDLWERLDEACTGKIIYWVWVRGHAGHSRNELADMLAENAVKGKYPKGQKSVKAAHPKLFIG